ncbi:MAG TPA: hypothetical protein DCQ97_11680 [Chitinophagaceae bacterium]|nr:hypothetical protein [Chitinophagaceae bacterium]
MNPSFNIQAPKIYTESAKLVIEAGPMGISFIILNTGDCFQAVVIYAFPNKLTRAEVNEELEEILNTEPLLKKKYKETHIIWSFPESILVPPAFFEKENSDAMLDLVFGDACRPVLHHDFLYRHNLHNVYRVPENTGSLFDTILPSVPQSHQYSLLPGRMVKEGEELFVLFYTGSFTIMLCSDGNLKAIQNFLFNTPEDIVYHLLDTCRAFDTDPSRVRLCLSGLVDKKSNLYMAIYKYFLHIEFDTIPAHFSVAEELKNQPPHFFSHLFYQAICV